MPIQDDFNDVADEGPSDEWFELTPDVFPQVPRPAGDGQIAVRETVALPVLDTQSFQERPDTIKAALVILSQSPTARIFAQTAIDAGYSIALAPRAPGADAGGVDTFGNTDHVNRRINVVSGDDPLRLAMTLAHELTHVSQIVKGGLDVSITALHPVSAMRQLLAMEGDARAHEFLIASELQYPAKTDPAERLLIPGALDMAADTIGAPLAQQIVEEAKPVLLGGGAAAEWMARIFNAFYISPTLRAHYEDTVLRGVENFEKDHPGTLANSALLSGTMPPAELVRRINGHGAAAYLTPDHNGYVDGLPGFGISSGAQQRLLKLESLRMQKPKRSHAPGI